ncbi:MAG: arsenite methyltransferase [Myxococcales bacterium]|nr:arsenite methyltransferase [Myxococcales bacterium]
MMRPVDIRKSVSESYARAVENTRTAGGCCGGPACDATLAALAGYSREALATLPADAVASSFGCGNPVALAEIREGDTVLDLGSGAGIDLLLAAKLAGPRGRVIGVDMTPAMIERARANAAAAGLDNVEVRQGIIEDLPVEAASIDLVLSNCVINLSPEKERVFSEIHRVLRPGGRFSIADMVAEPLPDWMRAEGLLYSACVAGAIPEDAYVEGLKEAGLIDVAVRDRLVYDEAQLRALLDTEAAGACCCGSASLPREKLDRVVRELAGKVSSVRVTGRKPIQVGP